MERRIFTIAVILMASVIVGGVIMTATAETQTENPDETVMQVELEENGDGQWTVIYRTELETDDDIEAFESLQQDIEDSPDVYEEQFSDQFQFLIDSAEQNTDREMSLQDVTVDTRTESYTSTYGIIEYQFTWTNFATVDDEIFVGDSIYGLYLEPDTMFVLVAPDDHEVGDVNPTPDELEDDRVAWHGERQFLSDEPLVEIVSESTGEQSETQSGDHDGFPYVELMIGLVVLVLVAGGGYWYASGRSKDEARETKNMDMSDTDDPEAVLETDTEENNNDELDKSLLSNQELVLHTLKNNNGRMKQQELVKQLDWTDAKTSRVVSDMRDEGVLDGFRLGRENVLEIAEESNLNQ